MSEIIHLKKIVVMTLTVLNLKNIARDAVPIAYIEKQSKELRDVVSGRAWIFEWLSQNQT